MLSGLLQFHLCGLSEIRVLFFVSMLIFDAGWLVILWYD